VGVPIENAVAASLKWEKGFMQVKSYSRDTVRVSWFFSLVLIFSAAFLIQGTPAYASDKDKYSGFLSNYSSLKPGPKGGTKLLWKNPKYRWPEHLASFRAIKIDGIKVMLSKAGQSRGVDATELARLADELHRQLIDAIKDGYSVTDKFGPGILRIIVALTDVEPSNTTVDTVTSAVPVGRVFSFFKKQATGRHLFVGSASVEGVFVDGGTGETLVAFVDQKTGDKGVVGAVDKMEDVKEAFRAWAKRLRLVLDTAYGKHPKN
jgi:hypothetical protein